MSCSSVTLILTCPAPRSESFSKEIGDYADNEEQQKDKRDEVGPQVVEQWVGKCASVVVAPVDP